LYIEMPTGGEAGGLGKKKDAMTEKLSAYDRGYSSFFFQRGAAEFTRLGNRARGFSPGWISDRGYSSFLFPRVVSRVDPAWK
jgi:hypothetical protein